MLILSIDTTGPICSCSLWDGQDMKTIVNDTEYSHLEALAPMVSQLLSETRKKPEELSAVAVSRGPGSFTGIRIGMVSAKGLAQVWDKPMICVPTLASFAYGKYSFVKEEENVLYCPLFDARRSQVYAAAYPHAGRQAAVPDAAYAIEDYLGLLKEAAKDYEKVIFFGDGIKAYKEQLENCALPCEFAPEEERFQFSESVARLAQEMFKAGELCDCYTAEPEYLRLSEAERKLKEKNA